MDDIKIEAGTIAYATKLEIENYLDDKELVCGTTNNINGIPLKNFIKVEKIEQTENFTVDNIKTELTSEKLNINNNVKIEDEITTTDDIRIDFDIKFLSCNHCNEVYQDYCTKCGMLVHILNGSDLYNADNITRKEVPKGILEIRESLGHFGIFAVRIIPEGVKFGPLIGLKTEYSWKIKEGKFIFDDNCIEYTSWMQHVNSTKNVLEQNLVVFQYENKLYYRSIRTIQEHEELLVYFGEEYEDSLNEDDEISFIPHKETEAEDVFACTFCCLGFSSVVYLIKHKTICPHSVVGNSSNRDIIQCPHCKIHLEQWESEYHTTFCLEKNTRQYIPSSPNDQTLIQHPKQQHTISKSDPRDTTKKHYGVKTYTCAICNREFKTQRTLTVHVKHLHSEVKEKEEETPAIRCFLCEYVTNRRFHLNTHFVANHFKDGSYECSKCAYQTKHKASLRRHFGTHEDVKRFKCLKCDYGTNRKNYLVRHFYTHQAEKQFKCNHCDYATNQIGRLKEHSYKHEDVKPFKCPECEYTTYIKRYLKQHYSIHEVVKRFKCSQCDYGTNIKSTLKIHFSNAHEIVKRFKCSICDYATNVKAKLTKHSYIHGSVKHFTCSICDYATNQKQNLTQHLYKHDEMRQLKCSICKYMTHSEYYLRRHLRTHEMIKRFKCAKCDYETKVKNNLQKHFYTHESAQTFTCSKCDYVTNIKSKFMWHCRAHKAIKRYKCRQCDYVTGIKNSLKAHLNTHKMVKLYKCSQCDYKTKYKYYLKIHFNTHKSGKEYNCSKCEYKTNYKYCFNDHLSTHETTLQLKCSDCDYTTDRKRNLREHSRKHDTTKQHQCSKCEYVTPYKHCLKRHLKIHK